MATSAYAYQCGRCGTFSSDEDYCDVCLLPKEECPHDYLLENGMDECPDCEGYVIENYFTDPDLIRFLSDELSDDGIVVTDDWTLQVLDLRGYFIEDYDQLWEVTNPKSLNTLLVSGFEYNFELLDLTDLPNLYILVIEESEIESLDLSNCTKLTQLEVIELGLQELILPKTLTELACYGNELESLDLSKCTALERVNCSENKLTSLNVSASRKLISLMCGENELTQLNVSKNDSLVRLECYLNKIAKLDVSKNLKLSKLDCSENPLGKLDVSKNTQLTYLRCFGDSLSELNVSANTALEYLYCSENQLTELSVSKNTKLVVLGCTSNKIEKLDVSKNTALQGLHCGRNKLSTLSVAKNTKLNALSCGYNHLVNLNLSKNTKLTTVTFENNIRSLELFPCQFKFSQLASTIVDSLVSDVKGAKKKTVDGVTYYVATSDTITYTYNVKNSNVENPTFTLTASKIGNHVYGMNGVCQYCGLECEHEHIDNGFCEVCKNFTEKVKTLDVQLDTLVWLGDSLAPNYYKGIINGKYETNIPVGFLASKKASEALSAATLGYLIVALTGNSTTSEEFVMRMGARATDTISAVSMMNMAGLTKDTKVTINGLATDTVVADSCSVMFGHALVPQTVQTVDMVSPSRPLAGDSTFATEYEIVLNGKYTRKVPANYFLGSEPEKIYPTICLLYAIAQMAHTYDGTVDDLFRESKLQLSLDTISFVTAVAQNGVTSQTKYMIDGVETSHVYADSALGFFSYGVAMLPKIETVSVSDIPVAANGFKMCPENVTMTINEKIDTTVMVAWGEDDPLSMCNAVMDKAKKQETVEGYLGELIPCLTYNKDNDVSVVALAQIPGVDEGTTFSMNGHKVDAVKMDEKKGVVTFAINVKTFTSVSDLNAENIAFYPNPASDYVTVACPNGKSVTISNMLGAVVYEGEMVNDELTINLTGMAAGTYVVKVTDQSGASALVKMLKK